MFSFTCTVCGYRIVHTEMEPPSDFVNGTGAIWCAGCDSVLVYENNRWMPVADSELARKVREHIKMKEAVEQHKTAKFKTHWLN